MPAIPWKRFAATFLVAAAGAALACAAVLAATGNLPGTGNATSAGSGSADANGTTASTVAAKAAPSVACVRAYSSGNGSGVFTGESASASASDVTDLGSGVVLSADGYILTCAHVVEGASALTVTLDGNTYEATVAGTDASSDLAVLKIDAAGLTPLATADSSQVQAGQWALVVGAPYGLEGPVAQGIVSAVHRTSSAVQPSDSTALYADMIQTDAAIGSGDSGGPLLDAQGRMIGINAVTVGTGSSGAAMGFAIPSNYALTVAQQLMAGKAATHADLGAQASGATSPKGARIDSVTAGGAAQKAGLKAGDVVTELNGMVVESAADLKLAVRTCEAGQTVTATVQRDGQQMQLNVTLGSDAAQG